MASKKEYEVGFLFSAALNGNFKGALSKAQQEFAQLGKEIQSLNRAQSDIAAYEKQRAAIQNTTVKLQNLNEQHDLLQKEIDETTGSTAGLEREKLKLEQRIKDTETALERQGQKLDATGQSLTEAGVDTSNLTKESERLAQQLKELKGRQDEVAESAGSFGQSAAESFDMVAEAIAAAGIVDALQEIGTAYMECVSIAADFQEAMSNVEALSGGTAQEMAALTAQAKELGATTKFTAKESADAMGYMAMAGWNAGEMISGMNGVLQLAAASGEDLATVSDIVTDSLSAFGLAASDTARFSDVLAAAATKSNTNVSTLGESFKYAASLCGTLGYSVEDAAVNLGIVANNGIKGSQAGTTLKTSLANLASPTDDQAELMERLGISMTDTGGRMLTLAELTENIRTGFSGLSEAEQAAAASTLFGKEAMAGMLAIINTSQAEYDKLAHEIYNCTGAAERMAAIKLDNLNGQLTLMDSAWDALKTTIGEQFNPELRELAELGTDALTVMDGFVQKNPAFVKGATAALGVLTAGTTAVLGLSAAVKAFKALNVASLFTAGPAGAIMAAVAGVAALTGAVAAAHEEATRMQREVDELTASAQEMNRAIEDAGVAYDDTAAATQAASEVAKGYVEKLQAIEVTGMKTEEQQREYQNTLALLLQTMPELSDCISQTTDEYGRTTYALEGSTSALLQNIEAVKKNAMAQAMQERLTKVYSNYSDVLIEAQKNSIGLTDAKEKLNAADKKYNETLAEMTTLEEQARKEYEHFDTVIYPDRYYELKEALSAANEEVEQAEEDVQKYEQALESGNNTIAEAEEEIALLEEAVRQMSGPIQQAVEDADNLAEVISAVQTETARLAKAYQDAYEAAQESIREQYSLWDELPEVVATSVSDIAKQLQEHQKYWDDYGKNLDTILSHAGEFDGLSQVVSDLAGDFSETSVNIAAGIAEALEAGDTAKLKEMIELWRGYQNSMTDAAAKAAEIAEDMPGQLADLKDAIDQAVEDMDQSGSAYDVAFGIAQAFADGASDQTPAIKARYESIAVQAINALMGTAYKKMSDYTSAKIASSIIDMPGMRGYASGTVSAAPGLSLVGEEGPELVVFQGGEKVLNAMETEETIRRVTDVYERYHRVLEAEAVNYGIPELTTHQGGETLNQITDIYERFHRGPESYAAGTESAAPGLALVGEEGPELVFAREQTRMNQAAREFAQFQQTVQEYGGSETVSLVNVANAYQNYSDAYNTLNRYNSEAGSVSSTPAPIEVLAPQSAGQTFSSLDGVKVEIHIHVEAGVSPETIAALDDYVSRSELPTIFAEAMQGLERDTRRRRFS